jgi:tetratricopeptide (TPR) repeat protein
MTQQTKNILISIIVLVIIILLGYFVWKERTSSAPSSASSTSIDLNISTSTLATSTNSGYTITPVIIPTSSTVAAPNFKAPLTFSASLGLTADEEASMQSQFAQVQATLAKTPTDFNTLIQLGDLRKEAGDYAGAAADWQYVSTIYPANVISFANLADLYTNFLPNYPKAATEYKQAIKNDPTRADLYIDLFQLYTNKYPQSAATAEAVLQQGIAANPNAADLKAALSAYESAHPGQ